MTSQLENSSVLDQNNLFDLCLELVEATDESSVIQILKNWGYWDDSKAWVDYGGIENNFSNAGNQQENADAALVEKIINSSDAVLLAKCLEEGVNPESSDAPQSIPDALNKYFKFTNGELSSQSSSARAKLAEEYIGLVATGSKKSPCLVVFDRGCGQVPSNFENTFLSLNASNKIKINFVQGRFNMGSTGALPFCGELNLQLIISKRKAGLGDNQVDANNWGMTIVRREPPTNTMKSSKYTYLAPGGEVLNFEADVLPILPSQYPDPYGADLEYGSYIKLYEYNIGPSLRTNILFDLYNRLNLLMPNMPLPIRMYERRAYSGHSMETTLSGLAVRIEEDRNKNLEPNFPSSATFMFNGEQIDVDIYAFKYEGGKNFKEKYAQRDGIVFSVNGQSHGFIGKEFFTRSKVGMGYIKDSLLISVDCSKISNDSREKLFMNSRDRLRTGHIKKYIEDELIRILSGHQGLKDLRAERKANAIQDSLADNKPLEQILSEVIKSSPSLTQLLIKGQRLLNPILPENRQPQDEFEGKEFPTFFETTKEFTEEHPRGCEIGRTLRLKFNTDAENQYLTRKNSPGRITIASEKYGELDFSPTLWNGTANITIELPNEVTEGDIELLKLSLIDDSRAIPIVSEFYISVIPYQGKNKPKKKSHPKPPPSDSNGKGSSDQSHLSLPDVYPVKRDKWEENGFDQFDALRVIRDDAKYDFYYNADNIHLKNEQKGSRDDALNVIDMQYKIALTLIGMGLIKEYGINEHESEEEVDIEKHILKVTRSMSPIILPMIRGLGCLDDIPKDNE